MGLLNRATFMWCKQPSVWEDFGDVEACLLFEVEQAEAAGFSQDTGLAEDEPTYDDVLAQVSEEEFDEREEEVDKEIEDLKKRTEAAERRARQLESKVTEYEKGTESKQSQLEKLRELLEQDYERLEQKPAE
jgi:predicted RNase H-like nuclease (RuvC/YqgF family)